MLNALQAHHCRVSTVKRIVCPVQVLKNAAASNCFVRGRPRASQEARWRGALAQLQLSVVVCAREPRINRARALGVVDCEEGCEALSKRVFLGKPAPTFVESLTSAEVLDARPPEFLLKLTKCGCCKAQNPGPARTLGNVESPFCSSSLITLKEDIKGGCCIFLLNYECVLNALQAHHCRVSTVKRIVCPVQVLKNAAASNCFVRGRPRASQEARWRGALAQLQLSVVVCAREPRINHARALGVVDCGEGCEALSKRVLPARTLGILENPFVLPP